MMVHHRKCQIPTFSFGLGEDAFTREYIIGQGHSKHCPVPSISCDLCTTKYEGFRRRCIFNKIIYLIFDLDFRVKVPQNVAQYPLHHVTYAPAKFEVAMCNVLGGYAFSTKYII